MREPQGGPTRSTGILENASASAAWHDLKGVSGHGKIQGTRAPGHPRQPGRGYRNGLGVVIPGPSQICGVQVCCAIGVVGRDESVQGALPGRLRGIRRREVRGRGLPGDVAVAGGIHGDCSCGVRRVAPQIGRKHERVARWRQFRDEGIPASGCGRLQGIVDGKIGGRGPAGNAGAPGSIDRDRVAVIERVASQERGVHNRPRRTELRYPPVVRLARYRLHGIHNRKLARPEER